MKILALGDIVGPLGCSHVCKKLWGFRKANGISFVVANGENADEGNGISRDSASELLSRGVDVITGGNHIFRKKSVYDFLDMSNCMIRPANYPSACPGRGYTVVDADGYRALVINVQGTAFMDSLNCPFETVEKILERNGGEYDFSVLDIHAEATSEKLALAHCFDGRINIIFGTHTHVPTADCKVLPGGTGYITDLGMCGVQDGVLGVDPDIIIRWMKDKMPQRFSLMQGDPVASGALFDLDVSSGRIKSVERVEF